jgi:acyl-CoA synthetase (AMP-forming)/AMP-acid ligase II
MCQRLVSAVVQIPPLSGSFAVLGDAFEAAAHQHGDRPALVDGTERLSFASWYSRSDRGAAELVARGVRPGDVVAIMVPTSIDYAVAYGAIVLAGAVVTGLNVRLGTNEIHAILERAAPRAVVFDSGAFAVAPLPGTIVIDRAELTDVNTSGLGHGRPDCDPSDPAVIIWTSGTTGTPKGAWFDHRNLFSAVASAGIMSHPYDVKLVGTPFSHAGYMAKIWDQLAWGISIVISPAPWTAADMARLIVDEQITVAGGVPTQWAKLLERPEIATADLSHVRLGLVATAPAPPELIERVTSTIGCPLVVRYAMTESPSITGTEPFDDPAVQFRTVGRPQAGMEVELVDGKGERVATGEVGRVRVRGACVMRGYWGDDALTASVLDADGWLTSSDLGRLDADGNLVLVGRTNDMYIRGGYNVYPLEVENVLAEHPSVDRVAVVGTAAPVIGEVGVAFVVPVDTAAPPSLAELRAWVCDRLADYKAPDRLVMLDALPLTAMMKIDKLALAPLAAATTDDRSAQDTTGGLRK